MAEQQDNLQSPLAVWRAFCARGKLAYQVDREGRPVFPPRLCAPETGDPLEWLISAGLGTVHATTAVHYRNEAALNVAIIQLDEGFRMMSRVEGVAADAVRIGMRVRVTFRETEDIAALPVFEPLEQSDERT